MSQEFKLVPARMLLGKKDIGSINWHCGDGSNLAIDECSEGELWIGTVTDDDGKEVYGLHILTADYPEEGSTTLIEFADPTPDVGAQPVGYLSPSGSLHHPINYNDLKEAVTTDTDKAWLGKFVRLYPFPTAAEELEAVLHWRDKHAQAVKERDALQQRLNTADQRVDELERKAKLYDQLQRGAELLPQGWMITVEVERDGGGVTLIDPQGNDLDYPSNRESMGDEVEDAIEEALAQQVES